MNYIDYGYANPTPQECQSPRYEPNPAKYLWEIQHDGFFHRGAGGHDPTCAVKVDLTPEQFRDILHFVESYPYSEYSLVANQCSSFVSQVALRAGIELECEITLPIDPDMLLGNQKMHLWTDPSYSQLTISSPDVLECGLKRLLEEGKVQNALEWYYRTHPISLKDRFMKMGETVFRFPERYLRHLKMQGAYCPPQPYCEGQLY
jgi:hypothetical protein